jgi:hypothetical protein
VHPSDASGTVSLQMWSETPATEASGTIRYPLLGAMPVAIYGNAPEFYGFIPEFYGYILKNYGFMPGFYGFIPVFYG